jgi:hypothetical protein
MLHGITLVVLTKNSFVEKKKNNDISIGDLTMLNKNEY